MDNQLSSMTGGRQTMSSWAKVIESYEAVPEPYKSAYKMTLGDSLQIGQQMPYTVFAPSIAGFRHKTAEKLLCEVNDTITVWERIGSQVIMTEYPLETITDLEIGFILLFSWITIGGVTSTGKVSSTTIEFNTATARHFAPFLNKMRPAPGIVDAHERRAERAKFDDLAVENFKFMNFAIESLVDGEKVIQTIYQPKINKPTFKLGWRTFYRALALAHLVILTDKELIVILDDERGRENRGIRYGGKWRYIALSHIEAVSLLAHSGDLLTLSLTLSPGGRRVEIKFEASRRQEIVQLKDEIEKLIS